jgi:uncharacterized protein YbjQ (UPF0145 family)
MPVMTGLSGNEMFCLELKNLAPGELIIGNSVHSLGIIGSLGASFQNAFGGEITQITQLVSEGRHESEKRLVAEAQKHGATGITGMTSELRSMQGNLEFLSVGSCVHDKGGPFGKPAPGAAPYSTSSNGQELYCLLDCGYTPKRFVIGNVCYSIGITGGVFGALRTLARGEVKEYSDIFNATRHLALRRISQEARAAGANAVLGIQTRIMPFGAAHEMLMVGTAASHPGLPGNSDVEPVTSDMTCEEMWNLASMGYMPQKLVLGTAVYALGVIGGLKAMFKSFTRGEISDLTSLIYDAREHAIGLIKDEAASIGADDVVGIKTHIHEFGNLIEFMAVGTAVKKLPGAKPLTASLPVQAVIRDRETWISDDEIFARAMTAESGGSDT